MSRQYIWYGSYGLNPPNEIGQMASQILLFWCWDFFLASDFNSFRFFGTYSFIHNNSSKRRIEIRRIMSARSVRYTVKASNRHLPPFATIILPVYYRCQRHLRNRYRPNDETRSFLGESKSLEIMSKAVA